MTALIKFSVSRGRTARAVMTFGFETLRLPEIVSFTFRGNRRSRAVMERLGMTRDPKDDFDHPNLAPNQTIHAHVLDRMRAA